MIDAFLSMTDNLFTVYEVFERRFRNHSDASPEIIQLNIHADARALIEQQRLEQWRRWVAAPEVAARGIVQK